MITEALLKTAGASTADADRFAEYLDAAAARYKITSPKQVAGFLAQASHESGHFNRLEENLYYTTADRIKAVWPSRFATAADAVPYLRNPMKLANKVYSGKLGNGNEASGDGARFLGRGLFQLTGRDNYAAATSDIGSNYIASPELVAIPMHAALTAAWFWTKNGCNRLIETDGIDATTRKINGAAMLGAAERREVYGRLLKALA